MWTKYIDGGIDTDVTHFDFYEALDCVYYPVLFRNLTTFGIPGAFLQWIYCYLQQRTCSVRLSDTDQPPSRATFKAQW
ncbi:hypothetical protein CRM22_010681 [Opisthorchis felineus]|uniref:Uncharacterized protein n=1 Tax=Opisthorchis felineus TaxID=147828 RepID=A0A4S2KQR3_OPIFE|nr:hypothetical protein CRM22_010681 [Opisthorchis felineus]